MGCREGMRVGMGTVVLGGDFGGGEIWYKYGDDGRQELVWLSWGVYVSMEYCGGGSCVRVSDVEGNIGRDCKRAVW